MIPEVRLDLRPVEYYKAFNDMPKPPVNYLRQGTDVQYTYFKLSNFIKEDMDITGNFSIVDALRDPYLNRIGINYSLDSSEYTDHAARLDDKKEIRNLSEGRPLIIEVCHKELGNPLYMTPATAQIVLRAIYIVYGGYIYRADKTANINLLYSIYSELYFPKFGGLNVEEGELRVPMDRTRLAFFYKPSTFDKLLAKYGIRNENDR